MWQCKRLLAYVGGVYTRIWVCEYARKTRKRELPVVRASCLKRSTGALMRRLKWALRGAIELKTKAERFIALFVSFSIEMKLKINVSVGEMI